MATPNANRGLVQDCETLLAAKDTLRGTATLDWATGTAVSSWEGITTGGTPSRVTELDLPSESLTGSIPAGLGQLFALTTLDLSNNQLTGDIPRELGWLTNLTELRLSGNSLTGCIPLALKSVATNDLSSLNLLYCEPPPPTNLSAGTPGEASVALTWDAVADVGTYRVEYREGDPAAWTTDDDAITTTTHTVDELQCETSYELRVSARGSGTTYAAAWGEPSAVFTTETAACTPPTVVEAVEFTVSAQAAAGTAVGTVTAMDADTVTYAITEGNTDGNDGNAVFAIGETSGAITVAGTLAQADAPYELTVTARDVAGGTATVAVTVRLTDLDYDLDGDGLLEVATLTQLNAVRWDLDGDGSSTNTGYTAAFAGAVTGMGCPTTGCTGYELMADLDFDTDGSGAVDAADDYWNGGSGWEPIGTTATTFSVTFDGNRYTIANLFIDRSTSDGVGLFGATGATAVIRNVRLTGVDVTGNDNVGALVAGTARAAVGGSAAAGAVAGNEDTGGLVGRNAGAISASYAAGSVAGAGRASGLDFLGGLVGRNESAGSIVTSYAKVDLVGDDYTGGLVGQNHGSISASYATGSVRGDHHMGGLVGRNYGTVTASYATGRPSGNNNLGGLTGQDTGGGSVTAGYWDTTTSGRRSGGGGVGQTTSELQTPTDDSGIYAAWDVDVDGVTGGDAPWHFGTTGQYPALEVDFDGDATATWQEFGEQRAIVAPEFVEASYAFEIVETADVDAPVDTVTAIDGGGGTATYAITAGNAAGAFAIDAASGAITVAGALDRDATPSYTLTVAASDADGRTSTVAVTVTVTEFVMDYDTDDDGLIQVTDLAQLDAIRWDLDGDGSSTETGYAEAFPDAPADMGCPPAGCTGYELMADLDFDTDGSGTVDAGDDYWNGGVGWAPLGDHTTDFNTTFEGNGHMIANLFIARGTMDYVGLFGETGPSGVVRHVGLRDVDVTGRYYVGGLVGWNDGTVRGSFVDGQVTARSSDGGGLVGFNNARIVASYAVAEVDGGQDGGGLAGSNGQYARILASYAGGTVTGSSRVGGLVGANIGWITAGYARGAVTGTGTVGGLVGANYGSMTAGYWDTTTSGQTASGGGTGKTTSELQTPTGYTGIYATWNLDLDGDRTADSPWVFGTASEYPVLQVDFDGNGTASWEEFGDQRPNRPPAFDEEPPIEREVDENTAARVNIGDPVTASDPDEGDVVTYALSGTDAASFDLVTTTGQLQTKAALDYETETEYVVTITASDAEDASASVAVTITVSDVVDTPTFVGAPYAFEVSEAADVGDPVDTVTATALAGGALTYVMTSTTTGSGDEAVDAAGTFAIHATSGAITVAAALDYEITASYAVTVTVSEAGGSTATAAVTITVTNVDVDYDTNNNGLIEVAKLEQLHAMRWDLDGDGSSTEAGYAEAFPDAPAGMGCPTTGCDGYELMEDLDFNTDGDEAVDADDPYWNGGLGWAPIGSNASRFAAVFEGNGHVIANLFIARGSADDVGLFGVTHRSSEVRHVGLTGIDVTGAASVSGLAGSNYGSIRGSYARGSVTGSGRAVGGLVGWNFGTVRASYADVAVTGDYYVGGLVGVNASTITASYARGGVTAGDSGEVGGLVGWNLSTITASYARGAVTGTGADSGGLVGTNVGTVTASYWDTTTSGQSASAAGVGKTSSELQTPTGYDDIYEHWNVDIDGETGNDDPWHFGTPSHYPVLQVDADGDGEATPEEMGGQRVNLPPAFPEGATTTRAVNENTAAGENIGDPVAARDGDEDDLAYALGGTDADDFDLVTTTGQLQTRAALDYEMEPTYEVTITVSDDEDGSATITVTINVGDLVDTPPAPANLAAGTATATSVPLSWDAVTGAAKYRVEYRATDTDMETVTWTTDEDTLTTATHTVDELICGTAYAFQVSTYGDGTTHTAEWSLPTDPLPAATSGCPPVFGDGPYTFGVAEDAVVETVLGTVTASVASDEAIAYAITVGNDGDAFAIDEASGALTVAAALDAATTATYTLAVQASVGSGDDVRTATTTVTLTVQGAPPAPANLTADTAAQTSVPLSWDAVAGAAKYRVEYRQTSTDTETVDWMAHDEAVTSTPHTVDGLDCGTAYEFQVTAFGDQVLHTAAWGTPATAVPATTTACAPIFVDAPFEFTVRESADVDAAAGTVLATDAGGGTVTHAIAAGNEAGRFAIDETTGVLTVAAALDYLDTASFTLTVRATSAAGTTDVPVTITVTGVDCANGTVIADPRSHAALVADCRVLLAAVEGLEGDSDSEIEGGGTLNWSEGLDLASWEGVSSSGTPSRVTGLDLSDKSLGGTIPSTLGTLTALTTLDLSDNALTGAVPTELSALTSLTTLSLGGNSLSGCVPTDIRTLAAAITAAGGTHDIAALSLPYCGAHAPVPTGVSASATSATSVTVSWDGATDVGTLTYRVEYREAGSTDAWTVDAEDVTATSHVVDGLPCGTRYAFQVSAKGDGVVSLTPWSVPSDTDTAVPLTVVDATMTKVGAAQVTVTWAYGTGCSGITAARYYINHVREFADGTEARGEFQSSEAPPYTLAADLTHPTSGSPLVRSRWIRLQILLEADDDVTERLVFALDPAPSLVYNQPPVFAQDSYEFSVAENAAVDAAVGSVSAPDPNVDDEVTYTITAGNTGDAFAIDPDSGAITVDAALDYETTTSYTLTVQAEDGDGAQDTVTVTVTVTDVAENQPPAFAEDSYTFAIAEDAAEDAAVGSVSAPDPDVDDEVTYTITAGNTGDAFAIDADSGAITVAAALDYETTTSYTLIVQAEDGDGAQDTATVTVTVTNVVDTAPPAPTNLTATVNEDGEVVLSWDAPTDDSITGYQILRRRPTEGESSLLVYVENTGTTTTTYTDTNVTAGIRHVYRVKAINAGGLSEWSNYVNPTP